MPTLSKMNFYTLKIFVFVFSLAFISTPKKAQACSCMRYSSYADIFLKAEPREAYFQRSVLVENIERYQHGVRARVLDVLDGRSVPQEIIIYGDDGASCSGPVNYKPGETWMAAVTSKNSLTNEFTTVDCANTALKYLPADASNPTRVQGKIRSLENSETLPLEEFKSLLPHKNYVAAPEKMTCNSSIRNAAHYGDWEKGYVLKKEDNALLDAQGSLKLKAKHDFVLTNDPSMKSLEIEASFSAVPKKEDAYTLNLTYTGLNSSLRSFQYEDVLISYSMGKTFPPGKLYINVKPEIEYFEHAFKRPNEEPMASVVIAGKGQQIPLKDTIQDTTRPGPFAWNEFIGCRIEFSFKPK